ncbi:MAG: DUF2971 domain-containing protein [Chitinophagaceae bacterium]|nr:MAG: DUF2971 domain-containing protein [Chitinophagaceae bacterium]
MEKLYKYRPLSDFLFKELYYQELYFASYEELNDPLDLSARIEFTPEKEEHVEYLLYFIFKTAITLLISDSPSEEAKDNIRKLTRFNEDEELRTKLKKVIYADIIKQKQTQCFISFDVLEAILMKASKEHHIDFPVQFDAFKDELKRLTKKFLENSYTTCFSERNDDFLMWSHYSSKHSGVCLEFTLAHPGLFPYELKLPRKTNISEYEKTLSEHTLDEHIYWDRINKVRYQIEQPHINFFDFSAIFENEYDCDLIGLSKTRWHGYAFELELIFATKTLPWEYEKEWRAIHINFGEPEHPEERIRHYPIEALSSIYFGVRTPSPAKKRISAIFKHKHKDIQFFDCKLSDGREISFIEWEDFE